MAPSISPAKLLRSHTDPPDFSDPPALSGTPRHQCGELFLLGLLVEVGPLAGNAWAAIALGAALGGAASNLIDRVHLGGIVDFIDVKIWPVFNIADAAIVIGAGAAALALLSGW